MWVPGAFELPVAASRLARAGYDAGLTAPQCVEKLDLGPYAKWLDAERIHANVAVLYREFAGEI